MTLLSILWLLLFLPHNGYCIQAIADQPTPYQTVSLLTIDSADIVIFDMDQIIQVGNFVEIPVFLETDDIINALDFSLGINTDNLIFDSVIDHTGELQFVAYLNPNDHKLRFTSNSFTPYPVGDVRVVSLRFQVVTNYVSRSDFNMITGYLNGEKSSADLYGKGIVLADETITADNITIRPNPASDQLLINSPVDGTVQLYDMYGHPLVSQSLQGRITNTIVVGALPRGSYILQIKDEKHILRTHTILLQ